MKKQAVAALCLAALMAFPTQAFAYKAQEIKRDKMAAPAVVDEPVKDENGQVKLTLAAATKLAKAENSSLKDWADNTELMEGSMKRAVQALSGLVPSTGIPVWDQDAADLAALAGVNDLKTSQKTLRYQEPLLEESVEYGVLSAYNGLVQLDLNLQLAQKNYERMQALEQAAALKHKLGVLSQNDLTTAQNNAAAAKAQWDELRASRNEVYRSLKTMLGVGYDFVLDYTPNTEAPALEPAADYVIRSKAKSNSLKIQELTVEAARYDVDFYYYQTEGDYAQIKAKLASAERSYKDAVQAYENNLYKLSENLPLLQQAVANKQKELEKAQKDREAGQLSLSLGLLSQNDARGLDLAVLQAQSALLSAQCDLSAAVYQYQHPDMAGGGSK